MANDAAEAGTGRLSLREQLSLLGTLHFLAALLLVALAAFALRHVRLSDLRGPNLAELGVVLLTLLALVAGGVGLVIRRPGARRLALVSGGALLACLALIAALLVAYLLGRIGTPNPTRLHQARLYLWQVVVLSLLPLSARDRLRRPEAAALYSAR